MNKPVWRVFRGPLSGRYYIARCHYHADVDRWEVVGNKIDVTSDVERLIADDVPEPYVPQRIPDEDYA